jgi:hypothetical protein
MKSSISHKIKHREKPRDKFYTPEELAKKLIDFIPLEKGDFVLDPALGGGSFYDHFPADIQKEYCEIDEGRDFYDYYTKVDWVITNPPYSHLDKWLEHTYRIAKKGFAYLLGINNITAKRIEEANQKGFFLSFMHLCKVFKWYGMSCFVIFEEEISNNIISFDRIVWRSDTKPKSNPNTQFRKLDSY